jgi:hypothetical protein
MKTEFPIVRIHDTDFYVNLRGMQFIQVDQPSNCIRFQDVQDNETHCTILYDTSTKNAFQGTWGEMQRSNSLVEVRLPCLAELDPPTMKKLIRKVAPLDENMTRALKALQQINRERIKNQKNYRKRNNGNRL